MAGATLVTAQSLARGGLRVFPCRRTKLPTVPRSSCGHGGFYAASNNEDVVAEHWRHFPGGLIGYPTGAVNNIDVLDIDEKADGHLWLADNWHRMPATFAYRTGGNGGWHFQFRHRDGQRSVPSGAIAPGVEIKGDGGYGVAWWAHDTFVLCDSEPAAWPDWLSKKVKQRPPAAKSRAPDVAAFAKPGWAAVCAQEVEAAVLSISLAEPSDRHAAIFRNACRAAEWGLAGGLDMTIIASRMIETGVAHVGPARAAEVSRTVQDAIARIVE